ncbi:MAG TPA: DUF4266 domain-containing protein [Polyangia bacterium]
MKSALLLFLAVAGSACAAVKPWQRELLTQPGMSLDAAPAAHADQHMLESREASAGGFGGSGGGCGCN